MEYAAGYKMTYKEFLDNCTLRGLCADEQETSILLTRDKKTKDKARIYTSDNTFITKIKRAIKKNPDAWEIYVAGTVDGNIIGFDFVGPNNVIKVGSGKKRVVSDEQKAAAAERLRGVHANTLEDTLDDVEDDEDDESEEFDD